MIHSLPSHRISLRCILILSTHLHLGLLSGLFPSGLRVKPNNIIPHIECWTRDISVSIGIEYMLEGRGSIPARGKRFFSTPQHLDELWGPSNRDPILSLQCGGSVKLTTNFHLVPRPRMVKLYLHSPIRLYGVVLPY
jgi:hypothetical protein